MPFELMYLLFLVLCFCTQPVGVVLSFGACFVEGESTIKSAAMPGGACVNESIYVLVSMIRNSTVPIPCTRAYFPFATLMRLNGTLCDKVVNTLRSLVQLEVAPESKIH